MARHARPNQQSPEYIAALKSANAIRSYWAKRGFIVNASVKEGAFVPLLRSKHYTVVTDLVNGMPRGVSQRFLSSASASI